ncbi:MAG TPA: type II secretion system F family protein [Candidatus Baltobacteraceae bacterium]|nr:type II secretion system F family protein [Candidatus Baltobacteraceae bacterium]
MRFYYHARSVEGGRVTGAIECRDQLAALTALAGRDLFVTSIAAVTEARGVLAGLTIPRPNRRATIAFFRSFATLVEAGVPITRAIDAGIAQSPCTALREALRSVAHDIENGLPLSTAMERRSRDFGDAAPLLVRAGETGGRLDEALQRLAAMLERRDAVARRIATSLAYPAFVAVAACGLLLFLMTGVLPMFQTLYEQMHVPLPVGTVLLLQWSGLLRSPQGAAAVAVFVVAACAAGVAVFKNVDRLRLLYRVPVAGAIARKAVLARIAHTLAMLLRSGVSLAAALSAAGEAARNTPFQSSLARITSFVNAGAPLAEPMESDGLFDALFVQLVRAGEEAGSLDTMLQKAAEYYHADVESSLDAAAAMAEPAMILILGAVIAALVASVMLPLYSMIGNIR